MFNIRKIIFIAKEAQLPTPFFFIHIVGGGEQGSNPEHGGGKSSFHTTTLLRYWHPLHFTNTVGCTLTDAIRPTFMTFEYSTTSLAK